MPTEPVIRAALDAAAVELVAQGFEAVLPGALAEWRKQPASPEARKQTAAAVAGFLRALAASGSVRLPGDDGLLLAYLPASLAAAVEAAAKGDA